MNAPALLRTTRGRAALAALVVVVVALIVVLSTRGGDDDSAGASASGSSASAPATTSAAPSASASTSPTATPTTPLPTTDPNTPPVDVSQLPPSLAPVDLTDTVDAGDGVTGEVTDLTAIQSTASGPGNIAGPALRVTIRLANGTAAAVSLDSVTVTMTYGADATPASPLDDPAQLPFTGSLEAGDDGTAVYVFSVPEDSRDVVSIQVSHDVGAPYMVFTGSAS